MSILQNIPLAYSRPSGRIIVAISLILTLTVIVLNETHFSGAKYEATDYTSPPQFSNRRLQEIDPNRAKEEAIAQKVGWSSGAHLENLSEPDQFGSIRGSEETDRKLIKRHAIATLLRADERSVNNYCFTLKSMHDNNILKPNTIILVFHDSDFFYEKRDVIKKCTFNPIFFYMIDFSSFPEEFDPKEEYKSDEKLIAEGAQVGLIQTRAQVLRFWTTLIWKHPIIEQYETIMRIDADSCFVQTGDTKDFNDLYLPLIHNTFVYRTEDVGSGSKNSIKDLYDFAVWYMNREKLIPANQALWQYIEDSWKKRQTLPIFNTNFEICRVSFFTNKKVLKWHQTLTERKPYRVLRDLWSDDYTRVFTMAMFSKPMWTLVKKHPGYRRGETCWLKSEDLAGTKAIQAAGVQSMTPLQRLGSDEGILINPQPAQMIAPANNVADTRAVEGTAQKEEGQVGAEENSPIKKEATPIALETGQMTTPELKEVKPSGLDLSRVISDGAQSSIKVTPAMKQMMDGIDYSRHAVVSIVDNNELSLKQFCLSLISLQKNWIIRTETPILIFHEPDFPQYMFDEIRKCSFGPMSFHLVNFTFPETFDPDIEFKLNARVANQGTSKFDRKRWGYAHVIRFWTSQVWKHPAVQKYASVMRLDSDSCCTNVAGDDMDDQILPAILGRYNYRINGIGTGINNWIAGLYDFAVDYMRKEGLKPRNPELWEFIETMWTTQKTLPTFHKNPEVSRVTFFLRPDVQKWLTALTDSEPFGVYRYRWSDFNTMVFTMAMFAIPESVLVLRHPGFKHGNGCVNYYNYLESM